MRKAINDTALLWIVVVLSLLVQALLAAGIPVPLLQRTGAWRMATNPWAILTLVAIGVATVSALASGLVRDRRRGNLLTAALAVLGVVAAFAVDAATGVTLLVTARMVYTSRGGATERSTVAACR